MTGVTPTLAAIVELATPSAAINNTLARSTSRWAALEDRASTANGLGVLVLVDHVLVDAVGHELAGLGFHPRRDEGGEVQPGTAIEQQLVVDQLVGDIGRNRILRQATLRRRQALPECGVGLGDQWIGSSGWWTDAGRNRGAGP